MTIEQKFVKTKNGKWVQNNRGHLRAHDIIESREFFIRITQEQVEKILDGQRVDLNLS